jgi:hypothetical protein
MKLYSISFLLLITIFAVFALTIAPVLADKLSDSEIKRRQVRVTTGIGAVQGWEQGLVQQNPNLARWHWDPIYYYRQGYGPVQSRPLRTDARTTPANVSRPTGRQINEGRQPDQPHDSRPVHLPYSPQIMAELQGRLLPPKNQSENTFGHKDTVLGKLMTPSETKIANYGNVLPYGKNSLYGNVSPYRKHSFNTALEYNSQNIAVYGKVINDSSIPRDKSKNIITSKKKQAAVGTTSRSGYGTEKNQ